MAQLQFKTSVTASKPGVINQRPILWHVSDLTAHRTDVCTRIYLPYQYDLTFVFQNQADMDYGVHDQDKKNRRSCPSFLQPKAKKYNYFWKYFLIE